MRVSPKVAAFVMQIGAKNGKQTGMDSVH